MKPELIVALDVPNAEDMVTAVEKLPEEINFYKVGLELFCAEGPKVLEELSKRNKKIFLDLKLHDIPRTVARSVQSAARHGVNLMTVHAAGGQDMLEAAADAAYDLGEIAPKLVAVTMLTSLDQKDIVQLGINLSMRDQALALGKMAIDAGIDGLVTSVHEVSALRQRFGMDVILVTPGIRLQAKTVGDQKRVATPERAVRVRTSYLVVGRPILQATDPAKAALGILEDIDKAYDGRRI